MLEPAAWALALRIWVAMTILLGMAFWFQLDGASSAATSVGILAQADYARSGTSNVSVVDTGAFWVDGYFEETKMANVHVGDAAEVTLLGCSPHLRGSVGTLTLGISTADAAPSTP